MTGKSDFSPEEWDLILQGPPTAGVMVVTAERGGALRESFALTKSYVEARHHHGAVTLLEHKASPDEVDAYKRFVVSLATSVANAHREQGVAITDKEQAVLDEITKALGVEAAQ